MEEVNAMVARDVPSQIRASTGVDPAGQALKLSKADRDLPMPPHEQVAASIRRAISDGQARQQIPHAKVFAAVLGVNSNTVLRAIHLLRDEGLLEAGRGKAITVSGTPEKGALVAKVDDLVAFAHSRSFGRSELVRMIEQHPASNVTTSVTGAS